MPIPPPNMHNLHVVGSHGMNPMWIEDLLAIAETPSLTQAGGAQARHPACLLAPGSASCGPASLVEGIQG